MRRVKEAKLALSLRSSLNCARRSTGNTIPFIRMRRLLLGPDVPIAIYGICIGARPLEPWVLVGGVVDYEIDQNTNAALFCAVRKLDEIAERTIAWIDIIIVGDCRNHRLDKAKSDKASAKSQSRPVHADNRGGASVPGNHQSHRR